jgi:hypothetical protein
MTPALSAPSPALDGSTSTPLDFFCELFGPIPSGSKFELRAKRPDEKYAHPTWFLSWDEFTLDRCSTGANIWYSAAYRQSHATRATLADLSFAPLVWLDADKLDPERKDHLQHDLHAFSCPPTAIISTSDRGLQAVWRLTSPLNLQDPKDFARLREIVYGLALRFDADASVHNPDRVLRAPATLNYGNGRTKVYDPPQMARLLSFDPARRYAADRFDAVRQPVPNSRPRGVPAPTPAVAAVATDADLRLDRLRVSNAIRRLIKDGPAEGADRSAEDMSVIVALAAARYSDAEIEAIVTNEQHGIRAKFCDKGADGPRYLALTIQKARQFLDRIPYRATEEGLTWDKPGGATLALTNFTARIVSETIEDDGTETHKLFELEARLGPRTARFALTPEEFGGMLWPIARLDAKAIVYPGLSTSAHARTAIQVLSDDITTRRVFTHTGWREVEGQRVYLHGGGAIGTDGPRPDVLVKLPSPLEPFVLPAPAEDPAAVRDAVRASLQLLDVAPDAVTIPLLAATYRVVLGGLTDFTVHLAGRSGLGKSELAALAMQHFGSGFDARHLPGAWSSTANSSERLAFTAKDALLVIDDFAPSGTQADVDRAHKDAARLLRAQGNGAGRGRLTADARQRAVTPPRGLLLSTGEDVPKHQSIRARLFVLELAAAVNWAALTRAQEDAARGVYAQSMASFIRWIAGRYEELRAAKPAAIAQLRAIAQGGQHRRAVDIVANLDWGFARFLEFAVSAGTVSSDEADALTQRARVAFEVGRSVQTSGQHETDLVRRYLSLLKAAFTAGHVYLVEARALATTPTGAPPDADSFGTTRGHVRIGWRTEEGFFLEPTLAFGAVQKMARDEGAPFPISEPTLRKRLHESGLLASTDLDTRRTLTVRRKFEGARQTVLHLPLTALVEEEAQ